MTKSSDAAVQQIHGSADADAIHLMHAAKLIHNEIFSYSSQFAGTLSNHKTYVPTVIDKFN